MNEYRIPIGKRDLIIKLNELAEQANGSVLAQYGETVILSTATMSDQERADIDFFPLTVNYEEKFYAAGKIRGSRFTKREARPSDAAITTSRLIDRTIRPLFPKDLKRDVQIISTCLSWDAENDPDVVGLNASSIALVISDIPWEGPVGAVRIGEIEGKLVINPTYQELEKSRFDVVFSGLLKNDEVIVNMIEGGFEETDENVALEAFSLATEEIKKICQFQKEVAEKSGSKKLEVAPVEIDAGFKEKIDESIKENLKKALETTEKTKRYQLIEESKESLMDFIEKEYPESEEKKKEALRVFQETLSEIIQNNILSDEKRTDGRPLDELRKINAQVGILPRTHGSSIFSRGQTKSLTILTLGAPGDHQILEGMEMVEEKRFFHHYNFPPYSVGEVKPIRGPSRRDIGHGMLAEKALLPVIPDFEEFPYTIRVVSEILSSNGSTSMASVSSASLSLMDAGVPIKKHVAGISIGIITGDNGEYKLLTDIQGEEDHYGGMDLKVAGTEEGLTVIQMDVKMKGIDYGIFQESLVRAKKARIDIIQKMNDVIGKPRESLSPHAPRVITFEINPEKIREVIGPGGKIINEIIDETGATIDIQDSGTIFVTSENEESAWKAVEWIRNITREVEVGEIFQGKVKRILEFGCFVEILPGQEGLVHVSKLADRRVEKVGDVVKVGQIIPVKVIEIDDQGRINLSLKDALKNNEN